MSSLAPAAGKSDFFSLTPASFDAVVAEWGWPRFRADQVRDWVYRKLVLDPERMTNLSKLDRARLAEHVSFGTSQVLAHQSSSDGTQKLLLGWTTPTPDATAETVMIPDGPRRTACVSSQVGCPVGCKFCASGIGGVKGNLTAGQIVEQVVRLNAVLNAGPGSRVPGSEPNTPPQPGTRNPEPELITNIVFMGMGEPMMNWKAVDPTLTILNDPEGLGIGARHITISTVGVLPGIIALGERPEQFRLAISIHAPNDGLRRELMPINTKFPLAQVIEAAKVFDRRVTFEYVMLGGVNDAEEHAIQLANLARECRAFVNLIPLHPGGAQGFTPTPGDRIVKFARELRKAGVEVAVRKSRGIDIAAACGQLRVERLGRRPPRRPDNNGDIQVA